MKLKLKFLGPDLVVSIEHGVIKTSAAHAVSFEVEVMDNSTSLADVQRFWEMERTFNELTKGRLHVELIPV